MLKIVGVVDDKYTVLDTDDGIESPASAEELVFAISDGVEFEGCEYGPKGLTIWYDHVEPYDVDIEVWKLVWFINNGVEVHTNFYEVSNLGRVRSLDRVREPRFIRGRVLRQQTVKLGYKSVQLSCESRLYRVEVHRLVAFAYIPNPNKYDVVNHNDEVSWHNYASNLEWCTTKYNANYGTKTQRTAESLSIAVRQYALDGSFVREYKSGLEVSKVIGCHPSAISACCLRKTKTTLNAIWRYINDDELYGLSEQERILAIGGLSHANCRVIRQYSKDGIFISEFTSLRDIQVAFGFQMSSISRCCKRHRRYSSTQGYIWRYKEDDEFAERPENRALIEEFHKCKQQEG